MSNYLNITVKSSGSINLDVRVFPNNYQQLLPKIKCGVVLVHQYSLLGGSQDLMMGIAQRVVQDDSLVCVTFNLRGVGKSSGYSTITGYNEINDVEAVCEWAGQNISERVMLVGSSAGAPIAGSAIDRSEYIKGYIGIGYTFGRLSSILFGRHFKNITISEKPKFFIMGSRDGFTSVAQLNAKIEQAKGQINDVKIFNNIAHFELEGTWFDKIVTNLILDFIRKVFG